MRELLGEIFAVAWLVSSAAFVASFVPRLQTRMLAHGHSLRSRRWSSAIVATILFFATIIAAPPPSSPEKAAGLKAAAPPSGGTPPPKQLTQQQILDARLAVCVAVADEYNDALASRAVKDTIVLANQYDVGKNAGGVAIGHEIGEYFNGRWRDADCNELSTAPWTMDQGYAGDAISLPVGAIRLTLCREANYCS